MPTFLDKKPTIGLDIFIEIKIHGFKYADCEIMDIATITNDNVNTRDGRDLSNLLIRFIEDNVNIFINKQLNNVSFTLEKIK